MAAAGWVFNTNKSTFYGYDNYALGVGSNRDLTMVHDGTLSLLKNKTGQLTIANQGGNLLLSASESSGVVRFSDGFTGAGDEDMSGDYIALAGSGDYTQFIANFSNSTSIIAAINGNASGGSRDKAVVDISTQATSVNSTLSFGAGLSPAKLDVFLNGQLMTSGTSVSAANGDFAVASDSNVTFTFNVEPDDVVTFIKP